MKLAMEPEPRKERKRKGAGRPLACDVAGREEHLLNTATEVFLEYGYADTAIAEIARRAGASKRTIYSRYPTKEALFRAVITRKTHELQHTYAKILGPHQPLETVLEDFGTHLLYAMSHPEQRSLYRVFVAESCKFPRLCKAFWELGPQRSVAMLRDYLAKHPEFRGKDPEYAAEVFWSLCCGLSVMRSQLHRNTVMSDENTRYRVEEAVRVFLSAYSLPPSRPVGPAKRQLRTHGH